MANCKEPPRLRPSLGSALGTELYIGRADFRIGGVSGSTNGKGLYRANPFPRPPGHCSGYGLQSALLGAARTTRQPVSKTVNKEA